MTLTIDDFRLCEQVAEDLRYIREAWSGELTEHVIRRESPVIRRLLVYGDYARAWRNLALPRQPLVLSHDLEEMLGDFPRRYVRYAFPPPSEWTRPIRGEKQAIVMANPGVSKGDLLLTVPGYAEGQGVVFGVVPNSELTGKDSQEVAQHLAGQLQHCNVRPIWLSEYLESTGAYVDGQRITRREVIDFVANAMGGTHYDPDSQRQKKKARALLKPLHVKWRGTNDVHAPWIEVMSIGQTVARSTDAMRYCAEFDATKPPEKMPLSDND